YYYPGSDAAFLGNPHSTATNSDTVYNFEGYVGGSWKWISLKGFYAFSDYFQVPDTKHTYYIDLSGTYDFGGGWGVNGHVGRLKVKNFSEADYTDYKVGVTKDLTGWVFGASVIGTNAKGSCPGIGVNPLEPYCFFNSSGTKTRDAGRTTAVLSVGKTF